VKTAIRYGREAVALFRRLDRPQMEQWCLIYLVLALALSGDHRQAKDALESMEGLPLSTTYYMGVDELHARAWTEVAGGDLHRGRQIFEEAANLGERIGDLVGAAGALYSLVRMGKDKHAARRLAALTGHIEGDLAKAWAAHSDALIRNDPQSLENVSIVFETMGAHLLAAEAAKDAAASWHRENQPRRTAAAERRAHELARFCEGASTPALRTIVTQTGLTPAENETALLAASGRSNKEIANRLSVSVRTVESRLFHAFRKLGITKRSELPGALRTEPIR
jgi:DNA-binding CsgD family transcriptional regulator